MSIHNKPHSYKSCLNSFPNPRITSWKCLYCPSNSPNLKIFSVRQRQAANPQNWEAGTRDCFDVSDLKNVLNSCRVILLSIEESMNPLIVWVFIKMSNTAAFEVQPHQLTHQAVAALRPAAFELCKYSYSGKQKCHITKEQLSLQRTLQMSIHCHWFIYLLNQILALRSSNCTWCMVLFIARAQAGVGLFSLEFSWLAAPAEAGRRCAIGQWLAGRPVPKVNSRSSVRAESCSVCPSLQCGELWKSSLELI